MKSALPGLLGDANLVPQLVQAVRDVVRVEIRSALTEQELLRLSALVEAIARDLDLYDNLSSSTRSRDVGVIDNALTNASAAMSLSAKYPLLGAHVLSASFSLRLIALHAKDKARKDKGWIETAKSENKETASRLTSSITEYSRLMKPDNRLTKVDCGSREVPISRHADGGTNTLYHCGFQIDGRPNGNEQSYNRSTAERRTEERRQSVLARISAEEARGQKEFVEPLNATIQKWDDAIVLWGRSR
ncbi:MAG: hypothetical protein JNM89_11735 [Hyphomicrobiaceae bacterium]|nr:hypothetical protein [Hyphomicrobiaceae bacterium]